MIRRLIPLLSLLFLFTCDDGDIITVDLEFDQELELCDNNVDSFLIYDLRSDPNESLSVIIPRENDQEVPYIAPTPIDEPIEYTINESTDRFIYRTYNRSVITGELCNPIPPADLNIVEDYEADSGTIYVTVTIEDDDGDGIPSDLEGRGEMDNNGNYPDAEDYDGDGIPNYLDEDDDNDNVPTRFEIDDEDLDNDNDPTTLPLDTDEDGIPDYLDLDDDGDGVNTILEDENQDKNPRNDQNTNNDGETVAHYLNPLEEIDYGSPGLQGGNTFIRTVTASFFITGINLEILSAEEIDFGTFVYNLEFIQPEEEED